MRKKELKITKSFIGVEVNVNRVESNKVNLISYAMVPAAALTLILKMK
jgi:hypothetical protein